MNVHLLAFLALFSWQVAGRPAAIDDRANLGEPRTTRGDVRQDGAPSGAEVDAMLRAVLARPEFQRSATSIWLDAVRKRIGDWLTDVLRRLTGTGLGGRAVGMVLAWTSSLFALAVLSWWLVAMLTRRSRAASLELGQVRSPSAAARDWARCAMVAASAGELRDAVRCAYRAALCRLDEQGVWRADESRTPREYVRLLPTDDPRFAVVADLTRLFEQVWYGRRPATDDDARLLAAHLERLGCLGGADRAI